MNYKQPCKKTKQLKRVRVTSDFAISLLSVTAFYRFFYSCNQINDLCTYWNKTYHLVLSALPQYVTKYTAVNINNFFVYFYRASACAGMQSAILFYCFCPSVRNVLYLSDIIILSETGVTIVFCRTLRPLSNSIGNSTNSSAWALNARRGNLRTSIPKSMFISETVRDIGPVTMDH